MGQGILITEQVILYFMLTVMNILFSYILDMESRGYCIANILG
jgi:hypothetical protein